jgi:hypothetical protein
MKVIYRHEISEKCGGDPSVKLYFPSEAAVCTMPSPSLDRRPNQRRIAVPSGWSPSGNLTRFFAHCPVCRSLAQCPGVCLPDTGLAPRISVNSSQSLPTSGWREPSIERPWKLMGDNTPNSRLGLQSFPGTARRVKNQNSRRPTARRLDAQPGNHTALLVHRPGSLLPICG